MTENGENQTPETPEPKDPSSVGGRREPAPDSPDKTQSQTTDGSRLVKRVKPHWVAYGIAACLGLAYIVYTISEYRYCEGLLLTRLAESGFVLVALVAAVWFVYYFTMPLPDLSHTQEDEKPNPQTVVLARKWMLFAYGFMLFALVGAILPYTFDFTPDSANKDAMDLTQQNQSPKEKTCPVNYATYVSRKLDAPMSVFRGCALDKDGNTHELGCYNWKNGQEPNWRSRGSEGDPSLSWIVHIGGNVVSLEDVDTKAGSIDSSTPETPAAPVAPGSKRLAGEVGHAGFGIEGGVVVPLYLIIFSLIGGAISLTRRVPEFQKQASPSYVPTKHAPKLSATMLREHLVFQVVQFISAPLLAIVAYHVLAPSSPGATVALAFGSGFASETVLLWIRGIFDKMSPDMTQAFRSGSIVGIVVDGSGQPVPKVSVEVVGEPGLSATSQADGQFVLNGVSAGDCALAAKSNGHQAFVRVLVDPDSAVLTRMVLP